MYTEDDTFKSMHHDIAITIITIFSNIIHWSFKLFPKDIKSKQCSMVQGRVGLMLSVLKIFQLQAEGIVF